MNNKLTARERRHVAKIKEMDCGLCGDAGPSDAHHVKQHNQYTVIPLCKDCHQGSFNGWHGEKRMWKLLKMDELDVLNETLRKILE